MISERTTLLSRISAACQQYIQLRSNLVLPKLPIITLKVRITIKLVTQPLIMLRQKCCRLDPHRLIKPINQRLHSLTRTHNNLPSRRRISHLLHLNLAPGLGQPATGHCGLGLAVFGKERRVADYVVNCAFHLAWQLEGVLEVVEDEFWEDAEALVKFEEVDFWDCVGFQVGGSLKRH